MRVVHTKFSVPLPQRTNFLPEYVTEVSLIHVAAPKLAAFLWETQDGWTTKWIDHRVSEKLWENSHKVPLTSLKTFSSLISPVHISP